MAEPLGLDDRLAEELGMAAKRDEEFRTDVMDRAAEMVIGNGGFCGESLMIAAFFGQLLTEHGTSRRGEEFDHLSLPRGFVRPYRHLEKIQFAAGEPFIWGASYDRMGVVLQAQHEDDMPSTLEYSISEGKHCDFEGEIGFSALILSRDSSGEAHFKEAFSLHQLRLKRNSRELNTVVSGTPLKDLVIGMPNIRQRAAKLALPDAIKSLRLIDESAAMLRARLTL